MNTKIVLLTGGSSGIGKATAQALRARGCTVYEMSRRPSDDRWHISGDVTNIAQARAAVQTVIAHEGRLDVLVNNAGFGVSGAVEFTDARSAQAQLDVNFQGMSNLCQAALPYLRAQGSGRIVNLSSVAAVVPIPFQAYYSASKAAINAFSMALANEVRPYGVSVCAVMPGDIRTGFTAARQKQQDGDEAYGGRIGRSVGKMERDEQGGMQPEQAAARIAALALKKRVKPLYAIRADYQFFTILVRLLPARLLNYLLYRIYAR